MTDKETLLSVLAYLESSLEGIPRELSKHEGFFTRYSPNPAYSEAQQAIASLQALLDKPTADDGLLAALKGLLADITEYQTINNLGGENNHWQVRAREAIEQAEQKGKGE